MSKESIPAVLVLADGKIFYGRSIGAEGETSGEAVFNTSMTGYQEILTDPSYTGQMICFTYPHIGNVGVNREDVESSKVHVTGVIVKDVSEHCSNHRREGSFTEYLKENNIVAISDIDTRELVLHLRDVGAQMGIIATGDVDTDALLRKVQSLPSMEGQDLVKNVSTQQVYDWSETTWKPAEGFKQITEAELATRPLVVAIDLVLNIIFYVC